MKRKLLIVDDEELMRKSLKTCLTIKGYEVETAQDSDEAFKLIEEFNPDIMLLDLYLQKGLSGIEILKRAKAMKPDLKVVMQTGFGEQKQIEQDCIRLGALKFLYKPMRANEITEELDKVT